MYYIHVRKPNPSDAEAGYLSSVGGCHPAKTQNRRAATTYSLFMCSASTIARPEGVKPITRVPSALHRKCSYHICARIRCFEAIALEFVASMTGKPEIISRRRPYEGDGNTVLNFKRNTLDGFRAEAIPTALTRIVSDTLLELDGNV